MLGGWAMNPNDAMTGFYMITASVMKKLKIPELIRVSTEPSQY